MKTLLVLRHAKSSWDDASLSDYDRPLNERGKREAPLVGEVMREHGLQPQRVLCSSAKRARKTAQKAIAAAGWDVEPQLLDELYLAPPNVYVEKLRQLADDVTCVLVVGHNPGLEGLVFALTGQRQHLSTAGLVQIELSHDQWHDVAADQSSRVAWHWRPKDEP